MNIHEYQAKELYRKYGIPVPKGIPCMSPEEATAAAKQLIELGFADVRSLAGGIDRWAQEIDSSLLRY